MDGLVKEGMDQFANALRDAQTLNRPKLIAQIHQDMAIADAQLGRGTEIASHVAAAAQAGGAEDPMQIEITAAANLRKPEAQARENSCSPSLALRVSVTRD